MPGRTARGGRGRGRNPPPKAVAGDPHARIHIAPVGFEVERVLEPLIQDRADRVYLLTRAGADAARPFLEEILRRLRRSAPTMEVEVRPVDIWSVLGTLQAIREIFEREGRLDRHAPEFVPVRVNVSTGTKITAIAGTLACMLWKGEPYYAQVTQSWYTGITPKVRAVNDIVSRVDPVTVYELRAPAPDLIEVLAALDRRGGELRKRELIRELGLDRPESPAAEPLTPQAQHSRLRRRLEPLEGKWGFVRAASTGARGRVRLTGQGRLALALFGGAKPEVHRSPDRVN